MAIIAALNNEMVGTKCDINISYSILMISAKYDKKITA